MSTENIRATLIRLIQMADNGDIVFVSGQVSSAWDDLAAAGALRIEWSSEIPTYTPVDNKPIAVNNWPMRREGSAD